jgi:photosystem II stability/assembly factor-like uncharacterized protein
MRRQTRIAAALFSLAIVGVEVAAASAQTEGQPDDTVWQVVASGNELRAVFFLEDGQRGWAVGSGGTILATRDGGEHWTPQESPTVADLHSVAFAADGQRGWAVGQDGTILQTTDGGGIWTRTKSPTDALLEGVALSANGQLWAVGANGAILKTDASGRNWTLLELPLPDWAKGRWFYGVASPNKTNDVWVVGSEGTTLLTTDRGDHWDSKSKSISKENLEGVAFADGQHGWVVGDNGTILKTGNGGITWDPQKGYPATHENLYGVAFGIGNNHGWAVGGRGTILATDNGGDNWALKKTSTSKDIHGVSLYRNGARGWAAGADGTILTTTNIFGTWIPQRSSTSELLDGVAFAHNGKRGLAVSAWGTILKTEDGGKNWTVQYTPTPDVREGLSGIAFDADGLGGWAIGDRRPRLQSPSSLFLQVQGVILTTGDGGTSWPASAAQTVAHHLTSVAVSADGRAWAVGYGGTILTRDNGVWNPQNSGTTENLFGVAFDQKGDHGLAVGENGTILATDGGQKWQQKDSRTTLGLRSVAFAGDGCGWAVGDSGTIMDTPNWGVKWELSKNPPTSNNLWAVAATPDRVWTVGDRGTILTTRECGEKWEKQTSSSSADLYAIAISADGSAGLAVGANGTVLIPGKKPNAVRIISKQAGAQIQTSFSIENTNNPWVPFWSAYIRAKKVNEENGWSRPIGPAQPTHDGEWQITWNPSGSEYRFEMGDMINQQIQIYAGGIPSEPFSVPPIAVPGSVLQRIIKLFSDYHIKEIIGIPTIGWIILNVLNICYYLLLFFAKPARLAQAKPWSYWIPKLPDWLPKMVLSGLCSTRRVCDAWRAEFSIGRRRVDDLNEFASKWLADDLKVHAAG